MASITIAGPHGQERKPLGTHNTLGRHPLNTHQILDRVVSKEHCIIDRVDGSYVLRDLGSLNGTYINGTRVREQVLHTGDEIRIGSTSIKFDEAPQAPPKPPPIAPSQSPRIRRDSERDEPSSVTIVSDPNETQIHARFDALIGHIHARTDDQRR
ncbi:MAG: FHA domain-containing protein [Polyangiales bacterium]